MLRSLLPDTSREFPRIQAYSAAAKGNSRSYTRDLTCKGSHHYVDTRLSDVLTDPGKAYKIKAYEIPEHENCEGHSGY